MHNLQQDIQTVNQSMEKALFEGRIRDFTKLISTRRNLLEELRQHPDCFRQDDPWIVSMRLQNQEWLSKIRKDKADVSEQMLRTRKKRSFLGQLHKAYVGRSGGGNVVLRKG